MASCQILLVVLNSKHELTVYIYDNAKKTLYYDEVVEMYKLIALQNIFL